MKRTSLSLRLVVDLLIGQLIVYLAIWMLNVPMSLTGVRVDLDLKIDDLAENRARAQVVESLRRGADGVPFIEPSQRLRSHIRNNPALKFAVFDLDRSSAFAGSSPELVARLERMGDVKAFAMSFTLDGSADPNLHGTLVKEDTPVGRVLVATYGYRFRLSDLYYFFRDNARDNLIYFLPILIAAAFLVFVTTRRGLEPLLRAANAASRIDMRSIDQRIPSDGIPTEALPLVDAVNQALERLDAGAARQRRFAANAAHELRTPVAILRTRIDALSDVVSKSELKRDVRRLQTIIDQLLAAARLGEHGNAAEESFDANQVVRELVADYAPLVIANDREIEFAASKKSLMLRGDRRALECVVANLVDNALRAEPVDGAVCVRFSDDGVLEVVDHGEGIAESERTLIFEPFWRKNETTRGSGLGLAIVKELVEAGGGTISVEETPGGGATFRVKLPFLDGDATESRTEFVARS